MNLYSASLANTKRAAICSPFFVWCYSVFLSPTNYQLIGILPALSPVIVSARRGLLDIPGRVYKTSPQTRSFLYTSAVLYSNLVRIIGITRTINVYIYFSRSIRSRVACKIYCWLLWPALAAAALIAAPVSLSGRIMILSRLLSHFLLALLCASDTGIFAPPIRAAKSCFGQLYLYAVVFYPLIQTFTLFFLLIAFGRFVKHYSCCFFDLF